MEIYMSREILNLSQSKLRSYEEIVNAMEEKEEKEKCRIIDMTKNYLPDGVIEQVLEYISPLTNIRELYLVNYISHSDI